MKHEFYHHPADAKLAMVLLCRQKQIPFTELGIPLGRIVVQCFNILTKDELSALHDDGSRLGVTDFDENSWARILMVLGNKCGLEEGFIDCAALVHYAQANCTLPEGRKWFKTDCHSQEEGLAMRREFAQLDEYKKAANLLMGEFLTRGKVLPFLANYMSGSQNLYAFLIDSNLSNLRTSSDHRKLIQMKTLAPQIGKQLKPPAFDMGLEDMVAEAKKRHPEAYTPTVAFEEQPVTKIRKTWCIRSPFVRLLSPSFPFTGRLPIF